MENNDYGIKEFTEIAKSTAVFKWPSYPLLALGEEVGEVNGKIAKYCRKNGYATDRTLAEIRAQHPSAKELREAVKKELGDVIWQWAMLCNSLDIDPAEVMRENNIKLAGRAARGTINGEGDER